MERTLSKGTVMHFYRPRLFELEELALPNVLADPLGVAGLDTLLAAGEIKHLAHLVGDAILPLHLSDPETHAPPGQPPRWTVPSVPQEGLHTPVANPFSMPVGGGGDPGGGDPPTPPKIHPVVQFDASSWPIADYPSTEIGPPFGSPNFESLNYDPGYNAYLWAPTFSGSLTSVQVSPPQGATPGYTLGPVPSGGWSSWAGQDLAGDWSSQGLYLWFWSPGDYAVQVGLGAGSTYQGFVTVEGGPGDGTANGQHQVYAMANATPGATIIAQPTIDNHNFCATAALILPNAPRTPGSFDADRSLDRCLAKQWPAAHRRHPDRPRPGQPLPL